RPAILNKSAVYVLQDLVGLWKKELGAGDAAWFASIERRNYTVVVEDLEGRYLPERFPASLPFRGLFQLTCDWSMPFSAEPLADPAVPIFSAPARRAPPALGVVRAELFNAGAGIPAAWALVEVTAAGSAPARGLSDEKG